MFNFFPGFRGRPISRWWIFLLLGLTGCRTAPLPKVNLAEPGWRIFEGQAAWRTARTAPEISGEILLAQKPDGRAFIQFTKTPFPLVIAQNTTHGWQLEFPAENKSYRAPGKTPSRVIWFQLPRAVSGSALSKNWSWHDSETNWRLENTATGESLEGYFAK